MYTAVPTAQLRPTSLRASVDWLTSTVARRLRQL